MKARVILGCCAAGMLAGMAAGCAKNTIDTAKLRATFAGQPEAARNLVDMSIHDIDTSNYVAALRPLEVLGFKYKLSPPERKELADTVRKLQDKAGIKHQ